jgi:hypothetical protein
LADKHGLFDDFLADLRPCYLKCFFSLKNEFLFFLQGMFQEEEKGPLSSSSIETLVFGSI